MKTVSTKLSKEDFKKFQEMCNHDGQCMSEELRELVIMGLDAYEEGKELEQEEKGEPEIIVEDASKEPKPIVHGKILDDNGDVIGTF
ncbi:hypothetical protein [Nitrosopumilus sp.]|uniref:hypothetical protein n=1 Tax=Nitrosopumilus sp. TaxID=2024843 RepID=UPI003D0E73CF